MLDFDSLLKTPTRRYYSHTVEGVGKFKLLELDGEESEQRMAEAKPFDDEKKGDIEGYQAHVYKWAARLVKGTHATKTELAKFSKNLSPSIAFDIYRSPVSDVVSDEAIEKN